MTKKNVCKICRRQNQKLFLKGDRCFSPKCPFVKRPYPPGPKKKRNPRGLSEYGKQLSEKQKLQNYYGINAGQFATYVKNVLGKRGKVEDAGLFLIQQLEGRLDNVIFKSGLARSRKEARELVSHRYFLVNNKPVNIASFKTKKDDEIALKTTKKNKGIYKTLESQLKNYQTPSWLSLDKESLKVKVISQPVIDDVGLPVDISSIFEFYSR